MKSASVETFEVEERLGKLLPSQREFIFAPERYSAVSGGFGSGKSRALVTKGLILSAMFPNNMGIIGRFRATDLEESTIPVFFEVCPPSWIRSYNKQSKVVTLRNNSQILFRHIHDPKSPASLSKMKTRRVGANLGWAGIDQMEELQLDHWQALMGRIRRPLELDPKWRAVFIKRGISPDNINKHFLFGALNPAGHDWCWKMFFSGFKEDWSEARAQGRFYQVIRPSKDVLGIAVNSEENRESNGGFVNDEYFDSLIRNYPADWVRRYVYCSFDDFTGKIYKDYVAGMEVPELASVHNIDPFPIPRHWELRVGIDVGGDTPWAVVPHYVDDYGNLIVTDGLVRSTVKVSEIAAWIKSNLPWDAPATQYIIDPENKLAMLELASDYNIHTQPAMKAIRTGIMQVAGYFHVNPDLPLPPWYERTQPSSDWEKFKDKGSPRIFVFRTFTAWRKDHDEYVWNPNRPNEPLKTDVLRFDTCDASRYVCMTRPAASELAPIKPDYSRLRQIDQLSAQEWEALDKRIAARQKTYNVVREALLDEIDVESENGVVGASDYEWW